MTEVLCSLVMAAYAALVGYAFQKKWSHSVIAGVAIFIGMYLGLAYGVTALGTISLLLPPLGTIIIVFSRTKG